MSMTSMPARIGPADHLPPPAPSVGADGVRHFADVVHAQLIGYRPLQLDLWVPEAITAVPVVLWMHGGGWLFGDRHTLPDTLRPRQVIDALLDAGLAVATVDYRLAKEAVFPAQLHDVKAAVRHLRGFADLLGLDGGRVGAWGESAGGHLALLLALTGTGTPSWSGVDLDGSVGRTDVPGDVQAAVDWYGPTDLAALPRRPPPPEIAAVLHPELRRPPEDALLAGLDPDTRLAASPCEHLHAGTPPILVVHGDADPVVPVEQSQSFVRALADTGGRVTLVRVPGAGHVLRGHDDIDGIVARSVSHLRDALR